MHDPADDFGGQAVVPLPFDPDVVPVELSQSHVRTPNAGLAGYSPESNENPPLPMGDIYPPDHFRTSADLRAYRAARRGYVAWFLNPAQFWSADYFVSGHVVTGRKPVQQYGGMAPFAQRANIPDREPSSYGNLVDQSTYLAGLDPNSGW